jgi:phenylpropionate dioxygenase-like ring-hydroxylating dioxygenase large terminal subunit
MLVSQIPALCGYWYPVAYSDEVGASPCQVRLFGSLYALWRAAAGEPPRAAIDQCPHRAGRLSQGWVDDGFLVCPYHGWRYDEGGTCVAIPSQDPGVPIPARARLDCVAAAERYGLVWLRVGEERAGIPVLEELEDPGYTLIHEMKDVWTASAPRMIDNALDVSHVSFVHRGTVGDPTNPRMSDFRVEREGERIRFRVSYTSRVQGRQVANVGMAGAVTRSTEAELVQPFVFRGALVYENGLRHVLFKTCTPIDDRTTLFFQFIGRNDGPPPERWPDIIAVDRAVQAEDRGLLEAIDPDFPLDITAEVHTKADRMTVEYRRILADLAAGPVATSA